MRRRPMAALIACVLGAVTATAASEPVRAGGPGCELDYRIDFQLTHMFSAEITVTNRGAPARGWTLRMVFPDERQQANTFGDDGWHQDGTLVTYREPDEVLGTGESVTVELSGSYEQINPIPSQGSLNGEVCTGLPGPSRPPTVRITEPSTATVTGPTTFVVSAEATDPDGVVTRVEFRDADRLLGVDAETPYVVDVTGSAVRAYELVAVAYDDSGQHTRSGVEFFTVLAPPIEVVGTIIEGVESGCVLVDAEQGGPYLLIGERLTLPPFGTRVRVTGQVRPDLGSTCQQGESLEVHSIEILAG